MTSWCAVKAASVSSTRKNLRISKGRVKHGSNFWGNHSRREASADRSDVYIRHWAPSTLRDILAAAKIEPTTRVKDLTEAEEQTIREISTKITPPKAISNAW
jgi:hypothetical protein